MQAMRKYLYLFGALIFFILLGLIVGPPKSKLSVISGNENIKIFLPQPGDVVGQPLVIVGLAREFESTFNYQLLDLEGHVMAAGYSMANAPDIGEFGAFSVVVDYGFPQAEEGVVKVFAHSPKDGAEIDVVEVPVKFLNQEQTAVKVYFDLPSAKTSNDPELIVEQCEGVFPVARVVPKTTGVARAAMEQLLLGPSESEQRAGYTTAINPGVKVRSIKIENGLATVDLSSEFLDEFGGSCRVGLVTDQIVVTLKQIPTIDEVNILIDGQKDQIQP